MQSSTTVMIRAMVMLGCLVAIPLVAIFGKSLPRILGEFSGSQAAPAPAPTHQMFARSPAANQPPPALQPEAVSGQSAPGPVAHPAPVVRETGPSPTKMASANPPIQPASFEAVSPAAPVQHARSTADFVESRLQQIPNVQYRIEYRGGQQPFYRFVCGVPLADGPDLLQYFQANDVDRDRAMVDVLRQVEAWWGASH